ncbi:MAG: hypothetical protein IT508_10955 [Burkholderiaceae bacterium]|nr:hypothetical protein [Burkholderiaceae bacterium]
MANNRANIQTSVPLSNLSLKVANSLQNFKAMALFPKKAVTKGTGKVRVYSGDNMIPETPVAGRRSVAPEIERKYSTLSFATERFKLRELITEQDKRDADDDIADLEMDAVADLTERLMLGLEAAAITKAFTAANFPAANKVTLGNDWSNAASDPIAEIQTGQEAILKALGGMPADSMALDLLSYNYLCRHPDIVDRVKYVMGQTAVVNETALSALVGLQVHVINAVKNTAQPDVAGTVTKAFMMSDQALIYRSAGAEGLRTTSFGRMLVPAGGDFAIRRYTSDEAEGTFIEASLEYALQFCAVDNTTNGDAIGGYLISNTSP